VSAFDNRECIRKAAAARLTVRKRFLDCKTLTKALFASVA
jgi:hypothetical protein